MIGIVALTGDFVPYNGLASYCWHAGSLSLPMGVQRLCISRNSQLRHMYGCWVLSVVDGTSTAAEFPGRQASRAAKLMLFLTGLQRVKGACKVPLEVLWCRHILWHPQSSGGIGLTGHCTTTVVLCTFMHEVALGVLTYCTNMCGLGKRHRPAPLALSGLLAFMLAMPPSLSRAAQACECSLWACEFGHVAS